MLLQRLKLFSGQSDSLSEEGASEFSGWDVTLAEKVVVLEEFEESDSVL